MDDGFDVARALAGGCPDRVGAWEFVREFAASWATPLTSADGFSAGEVQQAEERLDLRLPVALREAYGLFGRRGDLVARQDPLLEPDELLLDPSGQLLVFRSENQGGAGWGVRLTDLSREDPPVALFSDHLPQLTTCSFLDRVSLACVEMVLSEAVMARSGGPEGRACRASSAVVTVVEAEFAPVPLPPHPAWFEPMGPPVRWFSSPGLVLRLEPGSVGMDLVVIGRAETDLQRALDSIPGEWPAASPALTDPTDGWDMAFPF
ncbi:SMI1/KNR4 family protein [Streptomyces sp. I05A-00742]|uniref:SMI1/KNR4 family protein n=1 Tax=Streptomyces sp. I05A-00742 TaxID=2732853 RepID=UPI002016FB67|nr:SMI1/KNR4 family protein [Streptomyces sp. I05A-00742]